MNAAAQGREIVAAVLSHAGCIGMFKRSALVRGDGGLWHCITGYRPSDCDPREHAILEIREEAGLSAGMLRLCNQKSFEHRDPHGHGWYIHAFHFATRSKRIQLNWEHDAFQWAQPREVLGLQTVSWLENVLQALANTLPGGISPRSGGAPGRRSPERPISRLSPRADAKRCPDADASLDGRDARVWRPPPLKSAPS